MDQAVLRATALAQHVVPSLEVRRLVGRRQPRPSASIALLFALALVSLAARVALAARPFAVLLKHPQPNAVAGAMPTLIAKDTIKVLVTGAAGQIAYSLIFMIARGDMFGTNKKIVLHLLDIAPMVQAMQGVVMELEDCAYPSLTSVLATTDVKEAFLGVDVALLIGSFPRKAGMERKELLQKNASIFTEQGRALSQFSSRDVKVLVVGNPANTNCLIAMACAPSIPRQNFSCLTRLDHNRAKALLAKRLTINADNVKNVIIWGNHSATQYPDVSHATVKNYPTHGQHTPARAAIKDDAWLRNDFIATVQQRGAAIIKARKLSSAASAAQAICDHMHDWAFGTNSEIVSMGVASDGSYGVKEGIIYSFPVTCSGGQHKIVQGLNIDTFSRKLMETTEQELWEEREAAFAFLSGSI